MARTERPADHGGAASSLAIRPIRAHSILNHGVKVSGVQAISDCSLGELRVVLRLVLELEKVPAVCKDGRIIVADATIDLIPGKDGEGADGAVVTFVGVGAHGNGPPGEPRWHRSTSRVGSGSVVLPGDAGEPF
jgi:hypothetical protein